MPVYKEEKTNTWRVIYRYTDWKGERKQTSKRGFSTKREAQAWEREQLNKVTADVDMTFASFIDRYTEDMKTRLKENTWSTKEHIIRSKLTPYFGRLKLSNITPQQIITWQNELLSYRDAQGKLKMRSFLPIPSRESMYSSTSSVRKSGMVMVRLLFSVFGVVILSSPCIR